MVCKLTSKHIASSWNSFYHIARFSFKISSSLTIKIPQIDLYAQYPQSLVIVLAVTIGQETDTVEAASQTHSRFLTQNSPHL